MMIVGVTGGIGSGKTAVANILGELGAAVFKADDVAREITDTDPDVRREIIDLLGEGAYPGDRSGGGNRPGDGAGHGAGERPGDGAGHGAGEWPGDGAGHGAGERPGDGAGLGDDARLDRGFVARIVFSDPEKLAALNSIVHPRVHDAFDLFVAEAIENGAELVVKEAALILESGHADKLDTIVVVTAPEEVRLARVMSRDGTTEAAVRSRMRAQLPQDEMLAAADEVIENNGPIEELEIAVSNLYRKLTTS